LRIEIDISITNISSQQSLESRIDLDLYTNIVVTGRYTAMLVDTERTIIVKSFTPNFKSLHKVSIVDAAIECNYSYLGESCNLVIKYRL